jgi:PAS domain S-box-containing protein
MTSLKIPLFIGFILFFLSNYYVMEANGKEINYLIRHWGDGSGLPQNSVNSIIQTHDGYIWLATYGGLARFDGLKFTVFDAGNTPQLKSNRFIKLKEDRKGQLWIFPEAEAGVIRYFAGHFSYIDTIQGLPSNRVNDVLLHQDGSIWLATEKGIGHIKSDQINIYTTAHGLDSINVLSLYEDSSGQVWIGTTLGLNRWNGRTIESLTGKNSIPPMRVIYIGENEDNEICFASSGDLFRMHGIEIEKVFSINMEYTRHIYHDKDGGYWFSSPDGLVHMNQDRELRIFNTESGLSGNHTRCVWIDREENIWVGMEGAGLNQLTRRRIDSFLSRKGMPTSSVVPICSDGRKGIWIGSNGEGLFHLIDGTVTNYKVKDGLSDAVWSLLLDKNKNLWVGSWGDGLFRLDQDNRIQHQLKDELCSEVVCALYQDRAGNIWIGTEKGLNCYQNGKLKAYRTQDGLVNDNVKFITQDSNDSLWIGTTGGISHFNNGTFFNYTTASGLSNNYIRSIYEDNEGILWIGTYGGGLNRLKNGEFFYFNTKNGLYDNVVSCIIEDNQNNLWMTCNHGIYRVDRQALNDFAEGRKSSYFCYHYGKEEGMPSSECNGGGQPSGWKTEDGNLWFPTIKGVVKVDPAKRNPIPPTTIVEKVLLDGKALETSKDIVLPPGRKRLEFHYTGISFTASMKVRFQFYLEGFDSKWSQAQTARIASYTNVPHGKYTFRVRAANNEGIWSEKEAMLGFEVKPFFYQTYWFIGICLLLLGGIIFTIYEVRLSRLKARGEQLKQMVEERTQELGQANRKLSEANIELEKLSIVASETDNAVTIMDSSGNFEWVNDGFIRMYGLNLKQFIEKRGKNILSASFNPQIRKAVNECITSKKSVMYEYKTTSAEDKTIWTQTSLTPILNKKGELTKLVSIDIDISKIKEAELKAELANRSKSEFLARMSHEIRTPMNGVIGFADMLMDTKLSDEQLDYARTINRSGEALITLLNDILDFSKIEAGELSFDPIDFDPEVTVFDICDLITPRLANKPVEILCRVGDNVPAYIKTDPGRFRQVVVNLMGNAAKFTEKGEIELSLEIELEEKKRLKLHVKVRDTGIGIPAQKLEEVFNPFQQADDSTTRKYGGTGLGLAICKQISKLMAGDIWIESEEGKGSTFHFTCWVERSTREIDKKITYEFLEGKRILIVDDNLTNLEILSHTLERNGMRAEKIQNPDEVIQAIKRGNKDRDPFDMCIIDIQMPDVSGYDLCREIRNLEMPLSITPLLAFSSSTLTRTKKFQESGFDAFLPKPIRRAKILKVMERLLGKKDDTKKEFKKHQILTQHSLAEESKHAIRILLAEDNPINLKLAQFMLEKAGYTITVANNGKQAVDKYISQPEGYDLILMDIQMPVIDGREATRMIRDKGYTKVPIVAMTAEAMKGDREKCIRSGMNDYIAKPIKREIIYKMIKKWVLEQQ